jgi:DNA polymerase III epsilon subunit-like protein
MLRFFNQQWDSVDTIWIDTETTGLRAGADRCVQVGLVRFQGGVAVASSCSYINPGFPIPAEATAIHKITDEMVGGAPTLAEYFTHPRTLELLRDAQPAAYNAPFDKWFVPPVGEDLAWPWLDALSLVRDIDKYVKGKGRHRLENACQRHGVEHAKAHDAGADARAAGELFYKLGRRKFPKHYKLGDVLGWQRRVEAEEWHRFTTWLSTQPPQPEASR